MRREAVVQGNDTSWDACRGEVLVPGRRGNSISGLAKAVSNKLSSGKGGGAGKQQDGLHAVR